MNPINNNPVHTTNPTATTGANPAVSNPASTALGHKLRDSGYADFPHDNTTTGAHHSLDTTGTRNRDSAPLERSNVVPGAYPDTDTDAPAKRATTAEEPSGLKKIINKLNPLHHSPSASSMSSSDGEATARNKIAHGQGQTQTQPHGNTHTAAAGLGAGTAGAAAAGTAAAAHQHSQAQSKPKQAVENVKQKLHRSGSASSLSSSDEEAAARRQTVGTQPNITGHGAAAPGAFAAGAGAAGLGAGAAATRRNRRKNKSGKVGQTVENAKERLRSNSTSSLSSSDEEALARRNNPGTQPNITGHGAAAPGAFGAGAAGLGAGAAGAAAMGHHHNQPDQYGTATTTQSKPKQMVENVKQKVRRSGSASSISSSDEEKMARRQNAAVPGTVPASQHHHSAVPAAGLGAAGLGAAGTAGALHHNQHGQYDQYGTATTTQSKPKQMMENVKQKVRRSGSASSMSSSDEEKLARRNATVVADPVPSSMPGQTTTANRQHGIPTAAGVGAAGLGAGALGTAAARHHNQPEQYGTATIIQSKPKQMAENVKQKVRRSGSASSISSSDEEKMARRQNAAVPGTVPASQHHHSAVPAAGLGAAGLGAAGLGAGAAAHHRGQPDQYDQYANTQTQSKPKQMVENVKQKVRRSGSASSISSSDEEKMARRQGAAPTSGHYGAVPAAGVGAGAAGAAAATAASRHHGNQYDAANPQYGQTQAQQPSKPKQMMENIKQKLRRSGSASSLSSSDEEKSRNRSAVPGTAAGLGAGAAGATAAHKLSGRNKLTKQNPELAHSGLTEPQHSAVGSAVPPAAHTSNVQAQQPNYAANIAEQERNRGHWNQDAATHHQRQPTSAVLGNEHLPKNDHHGRNAALGLGAAGAGAGAAAYGAHHHNSGAANTTGIRPGSDESAPLVPADARTTDAVRGQRIREAPALPERNQGQHLNNQFQPPYTGDKLDSNIVSGQGIAGTHQPTNTTGYAAGIPSHDNNVRGVEQSLRQTHLGSDPATQRTTDNSHSFGKNAAIGTGAAATGAAAASGLHSHHAEDPALRQSENVTATRAEKPSLGERIKEAITGHPSSAKTASTDQHYAADPHYAEKHHVAGPTHAEQGAYASSANQPQLHHRTGNVREKVASGVAATGATGLASNIAPGHSGANTSSLPGPTEPTSYHHPSSSLNKADFKPGYSYPPEERARGGQMDRDAQFDPNVASATQMNRTTGLYADGGNFDAARPGAGHEASRLGHE